VGDGLFITFEGGEGSGKTTQIKLLTKRLRESGAKVTTTLEPGGTPLGVAIRRHLVTKTSDQPTPRAELLLYAADRAHHVETVIKPALAKGEIVICDRYLDATCAYQGWGRGIDKELIDKLNMVATEGLFPLRTLWLDIEPTLGVKRSLSRTDGDGDDNIGDGVGVESGREDRFEAEEASFHTRVREGYEHQLKGDPKRVRRIYGVGSIETVSKRVWSELEDIIGSKSGTLLSKSLKS
jgi:dTMP kinase